MSKEIPDLRKQKFLPYVKEIAKLYGLTDWVFEISQDRPSQESALASIFCITGRKYGYIRLSQDFLDSTREEQRLIILHELTHCHMNMARSFATDLLAEDKRDIYATLDEYGVDGIATAIAKFFPLPKAK